MTVKMSKNSRQIQEWDGSFGRAYTDRNIISPDRLDRLYKKLHGVTLQSLNRLFFSRLNKNSKILEVGSNVGNQLILLQKIGFKNLYGVDVNRYAVELSKARTKNINIIHGSALDIPYRDMYFDCVFTTGVLIHIHPRDISTAMREIYRCSRKFIVGREYYSDKYESVVYRGKSNLLWKANFAKMYTKLFPDLKIRSMKSIKSADSDNTSSMFLLEKTHG